MNGGYRIMSEFVNVNVKIGGKTTVLKMEKGTSFENNGGIYAINDDGTLLFSKDNTKTWKEVSNINMTAYQKSVFDAFANNDNQDGLSKKDILYASQMAKKGTLASDIQNELPNGYKIDSAKYFKTGVGAQVHVQHKENEKSQATLNFKVGVLSSVKSAKSKTVTNTKTNTNTDYNVEKDNKTQVKKVKVKGIPYKNVPQAKVVANADKVLMGVPYCIEKGEGDEPVSDDSSTFVGNANYKSKGFSSNAFISNIIGASFEVPYGNDDGTYKALYNELKKYDGKPITPTIVNAAVSRAVDYNDKCSNSKGHLPTTAQTFIALQEYLTPSTINKCLSSIDYIPTAEGKCTYKSDVNDVKNLYQRLTPEQREIYYKKLFTSKSVTEVYSTCDTMSSNFVDYIFDEKLSKSMYNNLKILITDVNCSGNGIAKSKTASKEAIDKLYQRSQITETQANELYELAGLRK